MKKINIIFFVSYMLFSMQITASWDSWQGPDIYSDWASDMKTFKDEERRQESNSRRLMKEEKKLTRDFLKNEKMIQEREEIAFLEHQEFERRVIQSKNDKTQHLKAVQDEVTRKEHAKLNHEEEQRISQQERVSKLLDDLSKQAQKDEEDQDVLNSNIAQNDEIYQNQLKLFSDQMEAIKVVFKNALDKNSEEMVTQSPGALDRYEAKRTALMQKNLSTFFEGIKKRKIELEQQGISEQNIKKIQDGYKDFYYINLDTIGRRNELGENYEIDDVYFLKYINALIIMIYGSLLEAGSQNVLQLKLYSLLDDGAFLDIRPYFNEFVKYSGRAEQNVYRQQLEFALEMQEWYMNQLNRYPKKNDRAEKTYGFMKNMLDSIPQ